MSLYAVCPLQILINVGGGGGGVLAKFGNFVHYIYLMSQFFLCTSHVHCIVIKDFRSGALFYSTSSSAVSGTRRACSWRKESSARVNARCFFRDFMGLKSQKFSWSLLARHLYRRQLACEPQTGSLAYFSVVVRNGTKNDQFSRERSTSRNMQAAALLCLYTMTNNAYVSTQGQTMLKNHNNLSKGALKLN